MRRKVRFVRSATVWETRSGDRTPMSHGDLGGRLCTDVEDLIGRLRPCSPMTRGNCARCAHHRRCVPDLRPARLVAGPLGAEHIRHQYETFSEVLYVRPTFARLCGRAHPPDVAPDGAREGRRVRAARRAGHRLGRGSPGSRAPLRPAIATTLTPAIRLRILRYLGSTEPDLFHGQEAQIVQSQLTLHDSLP